MKTVEEFLALPYARVLVPAPEGGFSAEIRELPGCVSEGETAQEALDNVNEAARSWIEAALHQGQKIPLPSTDDEHSGRFLLRMPRGLHRRAAELAQREGASLNLFIVSAIAERVGAEDLAQRLSTQVLSKIPAPIVIVAREGFTGQAFEAETRQEILRLSADWKASLRGERGEITATTRGAATLRHSTH